MQIGRWMRTTCDWSESLDRDSLEWFTRECMSTRRKTWKNRWLSRWAATRKWITPDSENASCGQATSSHSRSHLFASHCRIPSEGQCMSQNYSLILQVKATFGSDWSRGGGGGGAEKMKWGSSWDKVRNVRGRNITKNGPYTWGNFHACAITKFEKPQQLGRACSSVTTCAAASRAGLGYSPVSAGCCCMQAAAETTASGSTGKEDLQLKADRRVRHCKEVGLPEWPLAGRATVPRGL